MKAYLDASFLISLYSQDVNSASATSVIVRRQAELLTTTFAQLEFVNGMGLRVFRKQATPQQAQSSLDAFADDLQKGIIQLRLLPEEVFHRAMQISRDTTPRLGTLASDVLHLAAAVELRSDLLYSFDERLCELARKLGIKPRP